MKYNRHSYYLGMTFAFVECVLNDAKEVALTHPLPQIEHDELKEIQEKIIFENGCKLYWDTTQNTIVGVIYKYYESLAKYLELRKNYDLINDFNEFKPLLGYHIVSKINNYTPIDCHVVNSEDWIFKI